LSELIEISDDIFPATSGLKMPLRSSSSQQWLSTALANFDEFLIDHADCERKASAMAMSLVVRFSDRLYLIEPMIALAKEELHHFHEIYRIMVRRGLRVKANTQDSYVKLLSSQIRHSEEEYFMDRLLVASIIEARGCERFQLLAEALTDQEMRALYQRFAREEAAHHSIFVRILKRYFDSHVVDERLDQLLDYEARALEQTPIRPVVH
jgi:tRNA-(ms[2]io[6]A)-hydroxylase